MNNFIKKWLPLLAWAGLIFFLSHQPDLKSGLPGTYDFILRKIAHCFEYGILTWLFFRALGKRSWPALIGAIIFSILYAFSDEYHQSFIPGREASLGDVGIDSLGIFLSAWLIKKKML